MRISFKFLIELAKRHKKTLLTIVIAVLITILLQTLLSIWLSHNNDIYLPSIGTIHTINVEVYGGDLKELSDGQKFLNWGTVYPGMMVNRTLNVTSKSNVDAMLIIKTMNWAFNNSQGKIVKGPVNKTDYLTLKVSLNETLIHPNQTLELTLTLKVADSDDFIEFLIENDVKTFSFDICIQVI